MASPAIPRGWLGTSAGVFSLFQSDQYCGSYLTVEDAAKILQVHPIALAEIPTVRYGNSLYLSDKKLGRAWASGQIDSPRLRFGRGRAMVSFDELIIRTLIELTLPSAKIEVQLPIGPRLADFRVTYGDRSLVLEFCGPYHFIRRSRNQRMLDPRERIKMVEDRLQTECVIWPYWVQRCASNVRSLFDSTTQGIGSIWSTSALFGDFFFSDSAELILEINSRFKIERADGIGYIYTNEFVSKPVHPIVRRIREGREDLSRLIPPGSALADRYWLPRELWSLIR